MVSNIVVTYPTVGIDQPSEGFRTNFAITKAEIEALQVNVGTLQSNVTSLDGRTTALELIAVSVLDDISDVNVVGAVNNNVLTFQSGQWIASVPTSTVVTIDDLTDVDLSTPPNPNDILIFDGADWIAQNPSTSGILLGSNNLSDLTNTVNARTNLGLVAGGGGDIWVEKGGDTMTSFLTLSADPINPLHATTKQYVDNIATGLDFKASVHEATTVNLAATYNNGTSGFGATLTATIAGVFPALDNHIHAVISTRVLVKDQTNKTQNGIYSITNLGSGEELTEITTRADVANDLDTKYFTFNDTTGTFYVWFSTPSAGADPAPGGTGINVAISTNATAEDVAIATVSAINSSGALVDAFIDEVDFFYILNNNTGVAADSTVGTSGFTIATTIQGTVSPTAWVLTRATDADNTPTNEVSGGMFVFVEDGATLASTGWVMSDPTGIAVIGTDNLIFTQFSSSTSGVSSVFGRTGSVVAQSNDYTALQIANVPSGNISSVNVQSAIDELDTEKLALAGGTMLGTLTLSGDPTLALHAATKQFVENEILAASGATSIGDFLDVTITSPVTNDILRFNSGSSQWENVPFEVVLDLTPQLGGNLDFNTFAITNGLTEEILKFSGIGTAVNEITITNASTGNSPIISATGGDTNIGLSFKTKGVGSFILGDSSSNAILTLADNASGNGFSFTIDGGDSIGAGGNGGDLTISSGSGHTTGIGGNILLQPGSGSSVGVVRISGSLFLEDDLFDFNGNERIVFVDDIAAVNHIEIENESTGFGPIIRATGTDLNVDLLLEPKGTGEIRVGADNGDAVLAAPDGTTGSDNPGRNLTIKAGDGDGTGDGGNVLLQPGTAPGVGTDGNVIINDFELNEVVIFNGVGSAVNELTILNAATVSNPLITATGLDTNIGIELVTKGTGAIILDGLSWPITDGTTGQFLRTNGFGTLSFSSITQATGSELENIVEDLTPQLGGSLDVNTFGLGDGTNLLLDFVEDPSAVNYIEIENEATGSGPIIRANGTDTNIDLNLSSKGTGVVNITGNVTVSGTVDGRDLSTDGTKLDGIEAGATADQTAADIRGLGFFDITNDGTGSGLDADLLDGSEATAFAKKAENNTFTKAQRGDPISLSSSATITPDFDAGNNFEINTIGIDFTLANPSNMTNAPGQSGAIVIVQDGTGSRLLSAVGTFWKFPGGNLPTLSTAPGSVDTLVYYVRNSTFIIVDIILDAQ